MLLEGLEISEVRFSKVDLGDRLDAEYFARTDIEIEERLKADNATELREFGDFVASAFYPAATHLYEAGDVPFIRCVDCVNYPLITTYQDNSFEKIPLDFAVESKGINFLNRGEIVITKVGTPSYASMVFEHDQVALSRTVLGIKNIKGIDPYYLLIFLRSHYGFSQLQRNRELTIQYQLTLERVKKTLVFVPSDQFQKSIASLCTRFEAALTEARQLYASAEKQLLDTLGMANFSPSTEAVNVKSFKNSFTATGRLDAEYYQQKYEDYEQAVFNYPAGFTTIATEFDLVKETSQREKSAYNYIEIGDVNVSDGAASFNQLDVEELPANAKQEVRRGDLLISKVRPNRGAVAIIDFDDAALIVSGAFTVLREKTDSVFSNKTLKVLLRTPMYRDWMLKFNIGTQYPVIRDDDILNLPIPYIDDETQTKIAVLVKESFSLKAESERLLEVAKRAVEIAIEQDENAGMTYIEANS